MRIIKKIINKNKAQKKLTENIRKKNNIKKGNSEKIDWEVKWKL